jgi:hypothetical protein
MCAPSQLTHAFICPLVPLTAPASIAPLRNPALLMNSTCMHGEEGRGSAPVGEREEKGDNAERERWMQSRRDESYWSLGRGIPANCKMHRLPAFPEPPGTHAPTLNEILILEQLVPSLTAAH